MRLRDGGARVSQHQGTRPSLPLPSARQRLAGRRVSRIPRTLASRQNVLPNPPRTASLHSDISPAISRMIVSRRLFAITRSG